MLWRSSGIYSDVDINFNCGTVSSVTSMNLDSSATSRRSSTDLPVQIKQLIIDIQALDDKAIVLGRNESGDITVNDKQEYYYCGSTKAMSIRYLFQKKDKDVMTKRFSGFFV